MPNRERILVVEDHRDALAARFFVLTQAGYSVLTADDGAQALGADVILAKPVQHAELIVEIRRLLEEAFT